VDLPTGISMAYVETGDPWGEPVIFLHGYTDTSRSFWPTIRHLAELRPDFRILAPDLRGHGESSMPDAEACRAEPEQCFHPADFAADVAAFMDATGIDRAHIVGHSLGSLVAQEIALEDPNSVRRLVLIATAARTRDHPVVGEFLLAGLVEGAWKEALVEKGHAFPEDVYELTPLDADSEAERWLAENWVVEVTADPAFLASVLSETARIRLGTWLGVARALNTVDNTTRLSGLLVPTLILWPTQDVTFVAADQVELRAALEPAVQACQLRYYYKEYGQKPLPTSGLQEDDLGHNVQWGAPEAVARDLAAYLREDGEPTQDLPYADPVYVHRILTASGEARILMGRGEDCPSR
jgi:pimeloyl-ACP methyl ester carboxylesterase